MLRFADEVRAPKNYFDKIRAETPNAKALSLTSKLIGERKSHWRPAMAHDSVQDRLRDIVSAKKKARRTAPGKKPAPETMSNVVNIMDALRKSIDADRRGSRRC